MSNLSERPDSFAEALKPKPGDKLVGVVVDPDECENEYGSFPVVVVARDDDSEVAYHAFRTVAKNELAKQRPQVGDRIGIKYVGKPEGKDYELYRIKVERDEKQPPLNWTKYEPTEAGPGEVDDDDPSSLAADDNDISF